MKADKCIFSGLERAKRALCIITVVILISALSVFELLSPELSEDKVLSDMLSMSISRLLGAAAFVVMATYFGYKIFDPYKKPFWRSLAFALPCLAVAVNNFPIIALVTGSARLTKPASYIAALALQCISVGLFEEIAFRGVILLIILEKRRKKLSDVFLSVCLTSAVFGAIHLTNLFAGAGLGSVALQIGYSFLIGGMCSVVLLKTHNIWLCVLIHSVFDFGGLFVSTLGEGEIWDPLTVVITAVLAVAVAVYTVIAFVRLDISSINGFYPESISSEIKDKTKKDKRCGI